MSLSNGLQHGKIQILVNLANVVFRRHGAMVMFMHHGPSLALHITQFGSIHGMDTLHQSLDQS
jgi:hypothetical protein